MLVGFTGFPPYGFVSCLMFRSEHCNVHYMTRPIGPFDFSVDWDVKKNKKRGLVGFLFLTDLDYFLSFEYPLMPKVPKGPNDSS